MPKYLTSSTLWYSGIFAAAATFDAGAKKRRREQWDNAIADVRQELQQPSNAPAQIYASDKQAALALLPFSAQDEERDVFRDVDPNAPKPLWPTNTGAALERKQVAPDSIYANSEWAQTWLTAIKTPKKLASIQSAIEAWQTKLFLELHLRGWSEEAAKAVPDNYAKHILLSREESMRRHQAKLALIEAVKRSDKYMADFTVPPEDDVELCRFSQENITHSQAAVKDLNRSLMDLFDLQVNQEISKPALLAKVSYNLSLCSGLPDLKTFNTLLLGLSRMQDTVLVNSLVTTIRCAHVRPNEVTLAAVLRHYIRTDQADKFVTWIGYMRGKTGALCLANPAVPLEAACYNGRLVPMEGRPEKIIVLPYATPYVFSAVIEGVTKFAGFDAALSVCKNMGTEGWGLCMSGLTPLLQDCADRGDWKSGVAIWSQIQALKLSSQRRKGARLMTERIKLHTFATMLRLCSRCGEKDVFDQVYEQTMRVHENSIKALKWIVQAESRRKPGDVTDDDWNARGAERPVDVDDHMEIVLPDEVSDDTHRSAERNMGAEAASSGTEVPQSGNYRPFGMSETDSHPSSSGQDDVSVERRERLETGFEHPQLLEEQLHGWLPPGEALDEYELRERPMAMHN